MSDCSIFITCRDRVSDLRLLVQWLEDAGHQRITLLDNDSLWPQMLEYLDQSPHEVVHFNENRGSRALWSTDLWQKEPFVLTDPDVLPIEQCPFDLIDRLADWALTLGRAKSGVGLFLEDVPDDMPSLHWERDILLSDDRAIRMPGLPLLFDSPVDTTLAWYRAGTPFTYDSTRSTFPYVARHLPWYRRESQLDEEHRFYLSRADRSHEGTSWTFPKRS